MRTSSLTVLALVAGSPLVHAGGWVKSMFPSKAAASTQNEVPVDVRLLSIWSSFNKVYQEYTATATMSVYATTTGEVNDLQPTSDQIFTIPGSEILYQPTPEATGNVIIYHSVPVKTSHAVTVSSSVQPSVSIQPTRNTTVATSTKLPFPTSVPPPLNGVAKDAAPAMGAVAVALAGCLLF